MWLQTGDCTASYDETKKIKTSCHAREDPQHSNEPHKAPPLSRMLWGVIYDLPATGEKQGQLMEHPTPIKHKRHLTPIYTFNATPGETPDANFLQATHEGGEKD